MKTDEYYLEIIEALQDNIKAHEKGKSDFCKRLGCSTLHAVEMKFRYLEKELAVYKESFNKMAVEYAIAMGLTDIRDMQYSILDQTRKELEEKDDNRL